MAVRQRWRYIAQRALTNEFLSFNVPFARDTLRWDLSGPGALTGRVAPETARLLGADGQPLLQEWNTYLFAEMDGLIRWGGILQRSTFTGGTWQLEASGFSSYPAGLPYTGVTYRTSRADPVAVFKLIWAHLQAQPDGNLGVTIPSFGTIPAAGYIGSAEEPYELNWWEARDCGAELSQLAEECPFDWTESHVWSGSSILHRVTTEYPRAGRRRDDIAFVQGANIVGDPVTATRDGSSFANGVFGIGKGEGAASVRAPVAVRDGRLRRVTVLTDKTVNTTARMANLARAEMNRRRLLPEITEVRVKQHKNAPIGSWQLGDDVLVRGDLPWLGWTDVWSRIVGWDLVSETQATLSLVRSDSFAYGAT